MLRKLTPPAPLPTAADGRLGRSARQLSGGAAAFSKAVRDRWDIGWGELYPDAPLVFREAEEQQVQSAGEVHLTQFTLRLLIQLSEVIASVRTPAVTMEIRSLQNCVSHCLTALEVQNRNSSRELRTLQTRLIAASALPARAGRQRRAELTAVRETAERQLTERSPLGGAAAGEPHPRLAGRTAAGRMSRAAAGIQTSEKPIPAAESGKRGAGAQMTAEIRTMVRALPSVGALSVYSRFSEPEQSRRAALDLRREQLITLLFSAGPAEREAVWQAAELSLARFPRTAGNGAGHTPELLAAGLRTGTGEEWTRLLHTVEQRLKTAEAAEAASAIAGERRAALAAEAAPLLRDLRRTLAVRPLDRRSLAEEFHTSPPPVQAAFWRLAAEHGAVSPIPGGSGEAAAIQKALLHLVRKSPRQELEALAQQLDSPAELTESKTSPALRTFLREARQERELRQTLDALPPARRQAMLREWTPREQNLPTALRAWERPGLSETQRLVYLLRQEPETVQAAVLGRPDASLRISAGEQARPRIGVKTPTPAFVPLLPAALDAAAAVPAAFSSQVSPAVWMPRTQADRTASPDAEPRRAAAVPEAVRLLRLPVQPYEAASEILSAVAAFAARPVANPLPAVQAENAPAAASSADAARFPGRYPTGREVQKAAARVLPPFAVPRGQRPRSAVPPQTASAHPALFPPSGRGTDFRMGQTDRFPGADRPFSLHLAFPSAAMSVQAAAFPSAAMSVQAAGFPMAAMSMQAAGFPLVGLSARPAAFSGTAPERLGTFFGRQLQTAGEAAAFLRTSQQPAFGTGNGPVPSFGEPTDFPPPPAVFLQTPAERAEQSGMPAAAGRFRHETRPGVFPAVRSYADTDAARQSLFTPGQALRGFPAADATPQNIFAPGAAPKGVPVPDAALPRFAAGTTRRDAVRPVAIPGWRFAPDAAQASAAAETARQFSPMRDAVSPAYAADAALFQTPALSGRIRERTGGDAASQPFTAAFAAYPQTAVRRLFAPGTSWDRPVPVSVRFTGGAPVLSPFAQSNNQTWAAYARQETLTGFHSAQEAAGRPALQTAPERTQPLYREEARMELLQTVPAGPRPEMPPIVPGAEFHTREIGQLHSQIERQQQTITGQKETLGDLKAQLARQEAAVKNALNRTAAVPPAEDSGEVRRITRAVMREMEDRLRLERQRRGLN